MESRRLTPARMTLAEITAFMKSAWALLKPGAADSWLRGERTGDPYDSAARDFYGTETLGFTVRDLKRELDRGHYTETETELIGEAHGLSGEESLRVSCFCGRTITLSVHSGDKRERDIARAFEQRFDKPPSDMDLVNAGIQARMALRRGQWDAALGFAHDVLKHRPKDVDALLAAGVASGASGDLITSEIALTDVLEMKPDHVDALNNLAQLKRTQGKNAEALPLYERALKAEPNNHAVLYQWATLLEEAGRFEEAREGYEKAVAASPNPSGTWGFSGMDFTGAARHALGRLAARG
jgi:Flp pilus assembly protein TadD